MLNNQPNPVISDKSEAVEDYLSYFLQPDEKSLIPHLLRRLSIGRSSYGVPLSTHTGRNHLIDAVQEVLDGLLYLITDSVERGDLKSYRTNRLVAVREMLTESALLLIDEIYQGDPESIPDKSVVCQLAIPANRHIECTHRPTLLVGTEMIHYRVDACRGTCSQCPFFRHKDES